jgi:hypothetical protein
VTVGNPDSTRAPRAATRCQDTSYRDRPARKFCRRYLFFRAGLPSAHEREGDHTGPRLRPPSSILGARAGHARAAADADDVSRDPRARLVAPRQGPRSRHDSRIRPARSARGARAGNDRDRGSPRLPGRHRGISQRPRLAPRLGFASRPATKSRTATGARKRRPVFPRTGATCSRRTTRVRSTSALTPVSRFPTRPSTRSAHSPSSRSRGSHPRGRGSGGRRGGPAAREPGSTRGRLKEQDAVAALALRPGDWVERTRTVRRLPAGARGQVTATRRGRIDVHFPDFKCYTMPASMVRKVDSPPAKPAP